MHSRREFLALAGLAGAGVVIPSRVGYIPLEAIVGQFPANRTMPAFGETIHLQFSEYPLTVEPVSNYGPQGLSGYRILNDFIGGEVKVSGDKVAIASPSFSYSGLETGGKEVTFRSWYTNDDWVHTVAKVSGQELLIAGSRDFNRTDNLALVDLQKGSSIDVLEPLKAVQKAAGLEYGPGGLSGYNLSSWDINGNNIALTIRVARNPEEWGVFYINTGTGDATRVTPPNVHAADIKLEDKILVFHGKGNTISAVDLSNLNSGVHNLSRRVNGYKILGAPGFEEFDNPGFVVFNNRVQLSNDRNQLYAVDLSSFGKDGRYTVLRRPVSSLSNRMQWADTIIGDQMIYALETTRKDNPHVRGPNAYFVADLKTGKSKRISEQQRDELLMARGGVIYHDHQEEKSGKVSSISVRTAGTKALIQISDPRYPAEILSRGPSGILPGSRVLFESREGSASRQYIYILNLSK